MRLFVAIRFSDEVKNLLKNAITDLKGQSLSGNFTRFDNLHLTLAFIGETKNVAEAKRVIEGLCFEPFNITLGGFGNFGNLYWVGINKNPKLFKLAENIRKELTDAGFKIDGKKFKPHITIAREVEAVGKITLNIPEISMKAERVSLMKSERINGKLTYTEIAYKNCK